MLGEKTNDIDLTRNLELYDYVGTMETKRHRKASSVINTPINNIRNSKYIGKRWGSEMEEYRGKGMEK